MTTNQRRTARADALREGYTRMVEDLNEPLLPHIVKGLIPLSDDEIEQSAQRASIASSVSMPAEELLRHYATIHALKIEHDQMLHMLTCAVNGPWSDKHFTEARRIIKNGRAALAKHVSTT